MSIAAKAVTPDSLRAKFRSRFPRVPFSVIVIDPRVPKYGINWRLGPTVADVQEVFPGVACERREPDEAIREAAAAIQVDYAKNPALHDLDANGGELDARAAALAAVGRTTFPPDAFRIARAVAIYHCSWSLVVEAVEPKSIPYRLTPHGKGFLVETGPLGDDDFASLRREACRYLGRWAPKTPEHAAGFAFDSREIAESWAKSHLDRAAPVE